MTHDVTDRPPVHSLLADGTTVCIRPVVPSDDDQLEGLYEEMSPENLRLRFSAASHRSARLAAERACAPARTGYRALLAETQGRVIGLAEYDTGDEKDAAEVSIAVADGLHHGAWEPCSSSTSSRPPARRASRSSRPTRSVRTTRC